MQELKFIETEKLKQKPKDIKNVAFGTIFSDYMFMMDYKDGKWQDAEIRPYNDILISPANCTLHYGQAIFEGMKAYKTDDKRAVLFRPYDHLNRLNCSSRILDIPQIDVNFVAEALFKLIDIEKEWIPDMKGASLYIRPFIFANDPHLGVDVSKTYRLMIILSPVSAYYVNGFAPVKIMVEDKYVRAVIGGLGEAKTLANYAASLHAGVEAHDRGYDQVLWLDGIHHKYIEEVGSMNILFKIKGEIVTPELSGSILDGITRRTVLAVAKSWGIPVSERKISIDELCDHYEKGELEEVFGSGTAAVISPVGELCYKGKKMLINDGKIGEFSAKIFNYITALQKGKEKDKFNFIKEVSKY